MPSQSVTIKGEELLQIQRDLHNITHGCCTDFLWTLSQTNHGKVLLVLQENLNEDLVFNNGKAEHMNQKDIRVLNLQRSLRIKPPVPAQSTENPNRKGERLKYKCLVF